MTEDHLHYRTWGEGILAAGKEIPRMHCPCKLSDADGRWCCGQSAGLGEAAKASPAPLLSRSQSSSRA